MDKEFLRASLASGMTLQQIGQSVGLAKSTVSYHVNRLGLRPVNAASINKGGICEEVLEIMLDEELSLKDMADELGRSCSNVRYWLDRHGLPRPGPQRNRELARAARLAGKSHVVLECRKHGPTEFVLEGRGYYRCCRCRAKNVAEWRRRVKLKLVAEAGGACVICGYEACVAALQFHHVDPEKKSFALSRQGVTRAYAEAQAEARKCVLLCSNCHAEVEVGFRALPEHAVRRLEFASD